MKEVIIVEKIIRTLTEKLNYVVVLIKESKDIDKLTIDELQIQITLLAQREETEDEDEDGDVEEGEEGKAIIKPQLNALNYECPSLDKEVNYTKFDEDDILLMSYVEMPLHHEKSNDAWFLGSRCSNHMCGDKSKSLRWMNDKEGLEVDLEWGDEFDNSSKEHTDTSTNEEEERGGTNSYQTRAQHDTTYNVANEESRVRRAPR
ncbi:hypothetical protein CR513_56395, partial [Mucuna pruriens]